MLKENCSISWYITKKTSKLFWLYIVLNKCNPQKSKLRMLKNFKIKLFSHVSISFVFYFNTITWYIEYCQRFVFIVSYL